MHEAGRPEYTRYSADSTSAIRVAREVIANRNHSCPAYYGLLTAR
jgi:hypothetical protein